MTETEPAQQSQQQQSQQSVNQKMDSQANQTQARKPQSSNNKVQNKIQQALSSILGIPKSVIETPLTPFCKHDFNCIFEAICQSLRNFILVYGLKAAIELLMFLIKSPKMAKKMSVKEIGFTILSKMFNMGNLNAALFPTVYTLVLKLSTCLPRKLLNSDHGGIHFLAGALAASCSMLCLQQNRRYIWSIFLLSRAIDIFYTSLTRKGIIPKFKYDYVIFFAVLNLVTGYAYGIEPAICPPALISFYKKFSNWSSREYQLRDIWIAIKNNELRKRGIIQ